MKKTLARASHASASRRVLPPRRAMPRPARPTGTAKLPEQRHAATATAPTPKAPSGRDLAGRGLNVAQVDPRRSPAVGHHARLRRKPAATTKDAADLTAYFASLPKPAAPRQVAVRSPAPASPERTGSSRSTSAARQCHGPTMNGPRNNMGAVNENFAYFANLVYNHTTAMGAAPRRARKQRHQPRHGQLQPRRGCRKGSCGKSSSGCATRSASVHSMAGAC